MKFAGIHVPGTRDVDADIEKDLAGQRAKLKSAGLPPVGSGGYSEHPKEIRAEPASRVRQNTDKPAAYTPGDAMKTMLNKRKSKIDEATGY